MFLRLAAYKSGHKMAYKGPFIHIRSGSVPFRRASGQKRGVEGLFFLPLARRNGTDPDRICINGP